MSCGPAAVNGLGCKYISGSILMLQKLSQIVLRIRLFHMNTREKACCELHLPSGG